MRALTAAQELQTKAQIRLASLIEEKLVTRISVLSTLLGGGKTTERLLVRISIETHKTSPDFDQTAGVFQAMRGYSLRSRDLDRALKPTPHFGVYRVVPYTAEYPGEPQLLRNEQSRP
jgi:hypothetical protein